jgi:hypothetical protein
MEWCYVPRPNKFARRGAFPATFQPLIWHSHWPSRWGVRICLMQIDVLKIIVREPVIGHMPWRSRYKGSSPKPAILSQDHRILSGACPVPAFARAIASFINYPHTDSLAAMKAVPLRPMPPRRRREALLSRCRGSGKRLPRAAGPLLLQLPLLRPHRLPSCDPEQQKSPHHQARDTLQGDEGA